MASASSGEEFEDGHKEPVASSPPPHKKTRGINTKLKEDAPGEIEFNELSLPLGKSFPTLSTQVGIFTRNLINIKYKDWRTVPQEDKDRLWHVIRQDYNLPDYPSRKKKIMQQCSMSFKRFKTRLRNEFMERGKSPCSLYKFIEKSDWEAFLEFEATVERK
uniref:uncharacterized protein LOC122584025 n=1 Tax=Erigeron canadensis TaxID=72917 RepID=UPI001CB9C5F0|nr:uncharacterized protein LOC122584025 [Erigeron canadensis]